jgi:hypothetical protein
MKSLQGTSDYISTHRRCLNRLHDYGHHAVRVFLTALRVEVDGFLEIHVGDHIARYQDERVRVNLKIQSARKLFCSSGPTNILRLPVLERLFLAKHRPQRGNWSAARRPRSSHSATCWIGCNPESLAHAIRRRQTPEAKRTHENIIS